MSYVVSYKAADLKLDATVFKLFSRTSAEVQEINTLSKLPNDVMTINQQKRLIVLQKDTKTIIYNGLMVTNKDRSEEPKAALYYNKQNKTAYIPGHEGNDLTFHLNKEKDFFILKTGYFDATLGLVQDTIKSFGCSGSISYESDEADSDEEVTTIHYKEGSEVKSED